MSWKFSSGGGSGDSSTGGDGGCSGDGVGSTPLTAANTINGSYSHNSKNGCGPPRWCELNKRVKEMRRTYSQLFVKTPTNIKFRLISEDCLRIYFLLCPAHGREATLFYADFSFQMTGCSQLLVHEVLDTSNSFIWRRTSREEQLLSERRRCSMWGITHYQLHPDTGMLVFPAASTIFFCQHPKIPNGPVTPKELPNSKVHLNPQLCPSNTHLMAFSANRDVYIFNSKTGCEFRVSHCHTGSGRLEQDPLSAGVPAYVMQEEFSRYQGYWWQPRSMDGVHRLLYEEVDESKVLIVQFMSPDHSSLEEFRFPRAGASNATSRLRLAELSPDGSVSRVLHLTPDLEHIAPWHQYLVRVGWTPCGQFVWCQLLERRQRRLDLLLLPLALFSQLAPSQSPHDSAVAAAASATAATAMATAVGSSSPTVPQQQQQSSATTQHLHKQIQHHLLNIQQQLPLPHPLHSGYSSVAHQNGGHVPMPYTVLTEQQDHAWVEVHNLLYWFKNEDSSIRTFIWGSEESGHRHLYLYRVRLAGGGAVQVQQKMALTGGEWAVLSRGLWVDEARGLVYFMGLRDTPLEHHLYVVSLHEAATAGGAAGTGTVTCPQRLTTLGYSHSVFLNTDCQVFVTCYTSVNFPGASQVYRIFPPEHPGQLVSVSAHLCAELLPPHPASDGLRDLLPLVVPEVVPVQLSNGTTLYSMVFKPHGFVQGRKYPAVLHIYGGPQVQLVTNTFKGCRHMRTHMLAAHGLCVISVDSRGSDNRGVAFQTHIQHRMGTVEIADQVEALQLLSEHFPFIDLSRVGVFGWSYGGYLSLMALAQRGDVFKVAVAGAPVVNWALYDTGYTERYMDTPENNVAGYKSSSVLSFIKNFPDEEGRLLIVQGVIDENVHFCHTSTLIQHLVGAGKPYQLQVYPRERHCLRQLDSNEHYETQLLHFLLKGL